MYLMNKNTPLLEFDRQGVSYVDTSVIHLFPHRMQYDLSYQTKDILYSLEEWLRSRSIPMSRQNAESLFKFLNINRKDLYRIAEVTKSLSLNDTYWVATDDIQTWEAVNLYENSFSEAMADIALTGYSKQLTIRGNLDTPETTTDGVFNS
jgi:hypothetical protein